MQKFKKQFGETWITIFEPFSQIKYGALETDLPPLKKTMPYSL